MSGYATILDFLDSLEVKDRRKHEREVQEARLKPLLAKGLVFAKAGCHDQAAQYQHQAAKIQQRSQQ